jgi:UbiD family decarboxylase
VLDIKAIYHRNDPILVGVPPMGAGPDEMARYRAVLRSAMVKQNMVSAGVPEVQQVWCHEVGGSRMLHGISIRQKYAGHAVQAGHIAAQCGAAAYASKYVIVVDEDVDVTNLEHLLWAMLTRTDPKESIQFIERSWDSPADPRLPPERRAAGEMTHSVAIIDACKPYHWRHKFPPSNAPSAEVARKARERFGWLLDGSPQT